MAEVTAYRACDRCNARAAVTAKKDGNELLDFCRHHANEHGATLTAQGMELVDLEKEPATAST